MTTSEFPPGPISENDLREAWNQQADQFDQWDSLESYEQLAWAQIRAIAADRAQQEAPTPIDLDALLSPDGGYERGPGTMDDAQLVTDHHGGNEQWWEPMDGCDSLNNALWKIRKRILPHLRPAIAGIDVPGGDGDYGGLQELCDAEGVDVRIGAPLLRRARAAWGSTAPAPDPPTPPTQGEPSDELVAQWIAEVWHEGTPVQVAASDLHLASRAAEWGARAALEIVAQWIAEGEQAPGEVRYEFSLIDDHDIEQAAGSARRWRRPYRRASTISACI